MCRMRGVTLMEMITTLAVVSVGLGLGLPAAGHALDRVRAATTLHAVTASLAVARSTAISRRSAVTVCPSVDGVNCRVARDWSGGWIVFLDTHRVGGPARAQDVLRRFDAPHESLRLTTTQGRVRVRYLPNGSAAGSNASFRLCHRDGRLLDGVVVGNSGRVRRERAASGARCPA